MIDTTEGFDDGLSDDFVIILSNPPFFACDVGSRKNPREDLAHLFVIGIWEIGLIVRRWCPFAVEL